ncbi:hypothetical protein Metbo_1609 [Methanobacterium lacus]|uniref:Uncharacterized protein n=1 Tax=Methanobacterium lacus (strain AL-21) TaxID=877455 RepID=F0T985_METLA|nr:hypothetical protein [Methanobacterium lacus]ADZ09836.1 hypothetical protein Metbo_1609 [Methanobacterium lacus]
MYRKINIGCPIDIYVFYCISYIKDGNGGEIILVSFELQHWCCGPKGCELEIVYGEMIDAE